MTPRYYVINLTALQAYTDLASAQRAAESIDLSPGEEAAILVPIGITSRSVTTTWLGTQDMAGACEQATSTGWSWPILPTGHSYLNPEKLTVEQLGDGWRPLCTLDEMFPQDHEMRSASGWIQALPCSERPDDSFSLTYRTRAPIPTQQ